MLMNKKQSKQSLMEIATMVSCINFVNYWYIPKKAHLHKHSLHKVYPNLYSFCIKNAYESGSLAVVFEG